MDGYSVYPKPVEVKVLRRKFNSKRNPEPQFFQKQDEFDLLTNSLFTQFESLDFDTVAKLKNEIAILTNCQNTKVNVGEEFSIAYKIVYTNHDTIMREKQFGANGLIDSFERPTPRYPIKISIIDSITSFHQNSSLRQNGYNYVSGKMGLEMYVMASVKLKAVKSGTYNICPFEGFFYDEKLELPISQIRVE